MTFLLWYLAAAGDVAVLLSFRRHQFEQRPFILWICLHVVFRHAVLMLLYPFPWGYYWGYWCTGMLYSGLTAWLMCCLLELDRQAVRYVLAGALFLAATIAVNSPYSSRHPIESAMRSLDRAWWLVGASLVLWALVDRPAFLSARQRLVASGVALVITGAFLQSALIAVIGHADTVRLIAPSLYLVSIGLWMRGAHVKDLRKPVTRETFYNFRQSTTSCVLQLAKRRA
jgi:uncharacterized membrane protein